MNEFYIVICVIIGILLGNIVGLIALSAFRKNLIKNTAPCCAKCLNHKKASEGNGFVCSVTNKPISNLLFSGKDCETIKTLE